MAAIEALAALFVGLVGLACGWWLGSRLHRSKEDQLSLQLEEKNSQLSEAGQNLRQSQIEVARLEERIRLQQEKDSWVQEAEKEVRRITDIVLGEQREAMTRKGRDTFNETIKPVRDQIEKFHTRLETLTRDATQERSQLQGMLRQLADRADRMQTETMELTRALKGDPRMRGDWGEVKLARVLEESGLKEGREYQLQPSFRQAEEAEKSQRPDAIIHLPGNRQIVIDAKLTLNSWTELVSLNQDAGPEAIGAAEQKFLQAVETQIRSLDKKAYQEIPDIHTLDFVFMFVPIEAAYNFIAERVAEQLTQQAFKKRIVLVSPNTLFPLLRVIENIWRLERQEQNAQEIAAQAAAMYDKLCGFLESMEKLGRHLNRARDSYDEAKGRLHTGQGNLIGKAQKLSELGVRTSKRIPDSFDSEEESSEQSTPASESDRSTQ